MKNIQTNNHVNPQYIKNKIITKKKKKKKGERSFMFKWYPASDQ